jgi:putative hydroxymethylpyrimidine transport system substrate-binding protein
VKLSRSAELAALGVASCLLFGCGAKQELMTLPATPQRLVIGLDGPPGAVTVPLYAARALGDFARAGLAVTLDPEPDGGQSLDALAAGRVDIAIASEPDVILARARGEQVVSIAALAQGPLESLISVPPRPITAVSQLAGKTVATDGAPLTSAELATMLRAAGVDAASVQTTHPRTGLATPLKTHTAAAALGEQADADAVELGLQHHAPSQIKIDDAGVPTFNEYVLVVRFAEARNRGELLRTFLQAMTRAVHAEQAAPATAVAALLAGAPGLDRRFELASLEATLPALDPPGSGNPIGYQNPLLWRSFDTWMLANDLLTVHADAALAVDNEFLPGEGE